MFVSKYSASGNDFVIFHTFRELDRANLAKKLCNRFEGVGADGLIVLIPNSEYDFKWQFYNSDGSEANMCGNGSRATAHYAFKNLLADSKMSFLTKAGVISAKVDRDLVETTLTKHRVLKESFEEFGFRWSLIDTGVPHLVTIVDDLNLFSKELASKLRESYNANVNFAKVSQDGSMEVRTYERGVESETLACGTGVCASFLSANMQNLVGDSSLVYPKSKEELKVSLIDGKILFRGRVREVFQTSIEEII